MLAFAMAAAALPAAAQPSDEELAAGSGYRIVRFYADLIGRTGSQHADGHFRPTGQVVPEPGSDPILGSGPAPYEAVIDSNVDGKGRFMDRARIRFAGGELLLKGVYPTTSDPTPIKDVTQTVMVEQVSGGDGAFEGAAGYVMLNAVRRGQNFTNTLNGILFVKVKAAASATR
jgi:hypothetical protein